MTPFFIYTSIRGKHHSKELFKKAQADTTGRYATFVFSSYDNPYISAEALAEITDDMTSVAIRAEIYAEDMDDDPAALWDRGLIPHVTKAPALIRVVVGVDPSGSSSGNECGIITAGSAKVNGEYHAFILGDDSVADSPNEWAKAVVTAYHRHKADRIIGEVNYGGDMVEQTIVSVDNAVSYKSIRATRGKAVRAEPVVARYEQGRVHHVGQFPDLEDEMCNWVPGESSWSPNRVDGLVWAVTELLVDAAPPAQANTNTVDLNRYKATRPSRFGG